MGSLSGRALGPRAPALVVGVLVVGLSARAAHARSEPEKPRDAGGWIVSPGAMLARGSGGWHFDGELSATYYRKESFGIGVAAGGSPTQFYLEVQPVLEWEWSRSGKPDDGESTLLLGINPGVVVDWSGPTRTGGQLTVWTEYLFACCHGGILGLPLVPFGRVEIFAHERIVSAGLMLKIPLPVSHF